MPGRPDGYQPPPGRSFESVAAQRQIIGMNPLEFAKMRGLKGAHFTTAPLSYGLRGGTQRNWTPARFRGRGH